MSKPFLRPVRFPARAVLLAGVLAAAALAAPADARAQQQGKGPAANAMLVGVNAVRAEPLQQTMPVIGRLVARRKGEVAARISAPVDTFQVAVGDRVETGDVIAVLVKDELRWNLELRKAEAAKTTAALQTTNVELKLRRQELARLERLRQSAAFSQAKYEDKRQEVLQAESVAAEHEAALASARAQVRLAELNLSNADVRAPYGGVVAYRHTEAGSYVNKGQPLVDLIDDRSLEIEADVPSQRTSGLAQGTVVTFDLAGEEGLLAIVRATVPEENPLTRTRAVRFTPDFSPDRANLATSQSVTLHLPVSESRQVVTVHKDAVLSRKGTNVVFMVENGEARIRPVTLGEAIGSRFEVVSGLQPGDVVVVRGNERLRPNQKVRTAGPRENQSATPAPATNG
ncbi:MAG: efflux RND transporter periplasmic adaptor subunit [Rhodobacterales bacterium]|nr:efflux RND transporter periplasmic adaptor subunit [Rhodobacterales bacterium]